MLARHPLHIVLAGVAAIPIAAMAQDAPPPIDYDAPVYTNVASRPAITLPNFDPAPTPIATTGTTVSPAITGPARFEGEWRGRWVNADRYEGQWVGSIEPGAGAATNYAPTYSAVEPDLPDFVERCIRLEQGAAPYGSPRASDADLPERCRDYRTGDMRMAYGQPAYGYGQPAYGYAPYGYPPYGYTMVPSYEPVYVERRVIETVETVPNS